MKKLDYTVTCSTCLRGGLTGYENKETTFAYRHKDRDGEWCLGKQTVEQWKKPAEPQDAKPSTPEVKLPAMPTPQDNLVKRDVPSPGTNGYQEDVNRRPGQADLSRREGSSLPTLRDVMPVELQAVVPHDLPLEYLPLCWLVWKTAMDQKPAPRVIDNRRPRRVPTEETHADLYDDQTVEEPADPLAQWTPPPGGVGLDHADPDVQDDEEDEDEAPRKRTRVVKDPDAVPQGLGESGFSKYVEEGLLEFARTHSTHPRKAEQIALEALTDMRKGGEIPPGSAGKIILTCLLNKGVLKGAGKDGFIESKLGNVEDLGDGTAAHSAKALGMDERAAELGIHAGEE